MVSREDRKSTEAGRRCIKRWESRRSDLITRFMRIIEDHYNLIGHLRAGLHVAGERLPNPISLELLSYFGWQHDRNGHGNLSPRETHSVIINQSKRGFVFGGKTLLNELERRDNRKIVRNALDGQDNLLRSPSIEPPIYRIKPCHLLRFLLQFLQQIIYGFSNHRRKRPK